MIKRNQLIKIMAIVMNIVLLVQLFTPIALYSVYAEEAELAEEFTEIGSDELSEKSDEGNADDQNLEEQVEEEILDEIQTKGSDLGEDAINNIETDQESTDSNATSNYMEEKGGDEVPTPEQETLEYQEETVTKETKANSDEPALRGEDSFTVLFTVEGETIKTLSLPENSCIEINKEDGSYTVYNQDTFCLDSGYLFNKAPKFGVNGKAFVGWSDGTTLYEDWFSINVTSDITLSAVLEEGKTVSFDMGEGTILFDGFGCNEEHIETIVLSNSQSYICLEDYNALYSADEGLNRGYRFAYKAEKAGAVLVGWSCNGISYSSWNDIPIETNAVLFPIWGEGNTVTFEPGDGIGDTVQLVVPNNGFFYLKDGGCFSCQKDGEVIDAVYPCFSSTSEGSFITRYSDGSSVFVADENYYPEGDMRLTAIWEQGVVISLDPGEGVNLNSDIPSERMVFSCPIGAALRVDPITFLVDAPLQSIYSTDAFNFVKDGSVFVGWVDENNTTYRRDSWINPVENTVLTALYVEPTTIRLESGLNDNGFVEINAIDGGALVFTPQNTVKTFIVYQPNDSDGGDYWWEWKESYGYADIPFENDGKVITGWTDGTKIYDVGVPIYFDALVSARSYTAVWGDRIDVTVTSGEGSGGSVSFTLPPTSGGIYFDVNNQFFYPVRFTDDGWVRDGEQYYLGFSNEDEDYRFVGFSAGEERYSLKDLEVPVPVSASTVFEAVWEKFAITLSPGEAGGESPYYVLPYPCNGIYINMDESRIDFVYDNQWNVYSSINYDFSYENHALAGFSVGGVYYDWTDLFDVIPINGETTVTAVWTDSTHTVTITGGEGATGDDVVLTVPHGEDIMLSTYANSFSKEDYQISGWRSDGTDYERWTSIRVTRDMVIEAVWGKKATITFSPGDFGTGNQIIAYTYPSSGYTLSLSEYRGLFSRDGYVQTGWTDGTETYSLTGYVNFYEDTVLNPVWEKGVEITVSAGDASGDAVFYGYQDGVVKVEKEAIGLYDSPYSHSGYSVSYVWDPRVIIGLKNGNNVYYFGENIPVTGPMHLEAVWDEYETVTFSPGGGTINGEASEYTAKVPSSYTLWLNDYIWTVYAKTHSHEGMGGTVFSQFALTPRKDGYIAVGWRDKNGNEYRQGERVEFTDDMVFEPIWKDAVEVSINSDLESYESSIDVSVPAGGYLRLEYENNSLYYKISTDNDGRETVKTGMLNFGSNNKSIVGLTDGTTNYLIGEYIKLGDENAEFTVLWEDTRFVNVDSIVEGSYTYEIPNGYGIRLTPNCLYVDMLDADNKWTQVQSHREYFNNQGYKITGFKVNDVPLAINERYVVTGDVTLEVVWEPQITLTIESGGEAGENKVVYLSRGETIYYQQGILFHGFADDNGRLLDQTAEFLSFTREGYKLTALSVGDTIINAENRYVVTQDIVITAVWTKTIAISLSPGLGEGTEVSLNIAETGRIKLGEGEVYIYDDESDAIQSIVFLDQYNWNLLTNQITKFIARGVVYELDTYISASDLADGMVFTAIWEETGLVVTVNDEDGNYAHVLVHPGDSAILTVHAFASNMDGITYEWVDGNNVDLGETTNVYVLENIEKSGEFHCKVRDADGNLVYGNFHVEIENNLTVTSSDGEYIKTVYYGKETSLSVDVSATDDEGIEYAWLDNSVKVIEGETQDTLVIPYVWKNGDRYIFRATDKYGNKSICTFQVLTVNGFECHAVGYEPGWNANINAEYGSQITLQVEATADDMDGLTYAWVYHDGNTFINIDGENDYSLTVTATTGMAYGCRVMDNYGNQAMVMFFVSIENHLFATANDAETNYDEIISAPGDSVTLTVHVTADDMEDITYEWRYSDLTPIEGEENSVYTLTVPQTETEYQCNVVDKYGNNIIVSFKVVPGVYKFDGWVWNEEDYSSAKAIFVNEDNEEDIREVNATITSETVEEPTCEEAGEIKYIATVSFGGESYSDAKTAPIEKLGHAYGSAAYTWSDDNSQVMATRVCTNDASHIETETVNTSCVLVSATCETAGSRTYSAVFENEAFTKQTKIEDIPATGHNWGEPTYNWSDDNSTVTATRVCANNASHVETETAETVRVETKAATCEEAGETEYSAVFENEAFTKQTKKGVIPATGHNWSDWVYDEETFTLIRICANDETHIETIAATAVTEIKLSKETLNLIYGGSANLVAEVSPSDATDKTILWTSSDENVATVDENGKVTAAGAGTATITATAKGSNGVSASCEVAVKCATPVLLSITNDANGVKVVWEKSEGAERYAIFRKVAGGGWRKLGTATALTYTDTTAESGTTYSYTVRCMGEDGSYTSAYDTSGKSVRYIAAPVLTSVSNTATGVKVVWEKSEGAELYRVFRKTEGGSWKKLADTASLTYTDTTAEAGTRYSYTVRCMNSAGTAATSAYDTVGKTITYIAAPVLTSVTNTSTGVKVVWEKSEGAEVYRVFRKTEGGSWRKLADTVALTYTDTTAEAGATYSYTVRCINSAGAATSAYDTVGKTITYIAAPVLTSATNAVTGVKVVWEKSEGAELYTVFRKTSGGSWRKLGTTAALTYTDTTAASGTTYSYTVRCMGEDGSYTSAYDTAGKSVRYIAAPVLTSVTNVGTGVKVAWEKSEGAELYRVFRKTEGGSWRKLADTASLTYTDTTAEAGATYSYTVRCMNSAGTAATSAYDTTGLSIYKEKVVYYTPYGSSYHFSNTCATFNHSTTLMSGTIDEAISKGKTDPCNVCANGH